MPRKRKPLLVEIVWVDAITYTSTMELRAVLERAQLVTRTTSGYLLHEKTDDPDFPRLIVAHTYDGEDVTDVTVIPHGWVKQIKHRRNGRKKGAKPCPEADSTTTNVSENSKEPSKTPKPASSA